MRNFTLAYLKGWSGRTYNLGQNKSEQQTPFPPKSRMKPREGQKRSIFPPLFWGEGGGGGSGFSIYFVQDCSSAKIKTAVHFRQRKTITEKCPQLDLRISYFFSFSGLLFTPVPSVFVSLDQRSENVKPTYAVREEDSRYTRFEVFLGLIWGRKVLTRKLRKMKFLMEGNGGR